MADEVIDLDDVSRSKGAPQKHYVMLTHDEWLALQKAACFGGKLQSPTQLKSLLVRVGKGEYKLTKVRKTA